MRKLIKMLFLSVFVANASVSIVFAQVTAQSNNCCNKECTCFWNLSDGKLTITGSGNMDDYTYEWLESGVYQTTAPWGNTTKGNTEITDIIVDGITRIGDSAFLGAEKLKNIHFSDSVIEIGHNALHSSGLTILDLPDKLKVLEGGAIENLKSLKNLIIPDTVQTIGNGFLGRMRLIESVVIPDSVTTIGERFLEDCPNLKSVVIGSGVTSIGSGAFRLANKDFVIYCENTSLSRCSDLVGENNPDYTDRIKLYTKDAKTGICYVDGTYYANADLLAHGKACADKAKCDEIISKIQQGLAFEFNGKFYASLSDLTKGRNIIKRIYTIEEAEKVSKKTGNTFRLRYK